MDVPTRNSINERRKDVSPFSLSLPRISMILTRSCWPRSNHDSEKRFRDDRGPRADRVGRAGPRASSRHEVASLTANSSGFEYIRVIREGLIGYETRIRFWSLTMTATKHVLSLYIHIYILSHVYAPVRSGTFRKICFRACSLDEL